MKKWFVVAGARPNFMKIAPLIRAVAASACSVDLRVVHTGQHYDFDMSDSFFEDLEIPKPDYHLAGGGGTHAKQTGQIMISFEALCELKKPDLVVVVGDVNSTLACALAARKLNIPIAHVEAGLRSFDKTMPEEVNRVLTDHMSDILFCTELSAATNLMNESISNDVIEIPGDVMIDSLRWQLDRLPDNVPGILSALKPKGYVLLTIHRPSNVDDPERLAELVRVINEVSATRPIIFPVHPRTDEKLRNLKEGEFAAENVYACDPLGYPVMVKLMKDALLVITDSGGMQVETSFLGVPCLTLRENTERPISLKATNRLIRYNTLDCIVPCVEDLVHEYPVCQVTAGLENEYTEFLWDGHAAERIVKILMERYS